MANDVKWIKMMVGMFDGMSFKKIKRAKIGGESFRDKLTAVWFELMDFAGKCNHNGAFIGPTEIPFTELSDIAAMIDRDTEELELCMAFFVREGMVTIIDDVYCLSNWAEYQNEDGLEKIRAQTRERVARHRAAKKLLCSGVTVTDCNADGNATGNVTVTHGNALEEDKERDIEGEKEKEIYKEKEKPTTSTSTARATAKSAAVDLFLRKVNPNASGECLRELLDFETQLGSEVCEYAINYAIDEQKTSWSYIRAILSSFVKDGVLSMDDIRRREQMRQQRSGKSGSRTERNLGNPFLRDDI